MSGLETDTIGGFNSMIAKQKRKRARRWSPPYSLTTRGVVIHDRPPLEDVPPMTEKEYFTLGCTALLDAVGGAIHHIGTSTSTPAAKMYRKKTMFIITTDGYENASRRY